jgi:hypothetical protein
LKLFFDGFEGFFYGFGLWEVKMLWAQVVGVTLVYPRLLAEGRDGPSNTINNNRRREG